MSFDRTYVEPTPEDAAVARRLRRERRWRTFGRGVLGLVGIAVLAYLVVTKTDLEQLLTPEPAAPAVEAPVVEAPFDQSIPAGATKATVNYVHDGDTLFIDTPRDANLKVRLLGVDTPEVGDNLECYGNEARDYLRGLLPEGSTVYTQADVEPLDQYGRSLLFVYTADGVLANYELVSQGYAESVFIGDNRLLENEFEAAEDKAQSGGLGIWGGC